MTLVGCRAHVRRKFDEVLKALPANKRASPVTAECGLEFCNYLFAIERDLEEATPNERFQARLRRSQPVLDAFSAWVYDQDSKVMPKTSLEQAIGYCSNQRDKLTAFMQDDRLEISNNRS